MKFEKEMRLKLKNLPDHQDVKKNLRPLRHLISRSLLETTSPKKFKTLVELLLKEKPVKIADIRKKYIETELKKENEVLKQKGKEFAVLKKSALKWIKENFPEERLRELWEKHQSWLPRRDTLYKKKTPFQKIAADTLARFKLINKI